MAATPSTQKTDRLDSVDTDRLDDPMSPIITDGDNGPGSDNDSKRNDAAKEGSNSAEQGFPGLSAEIQALKAKLFALEEHASQMTGGEAKESPPDLMADLEEYKRMEACLKTHRKEWERSTGPGRYGIRHYGPPPYQRNISNRHEPFSIPWNIESERYFTRLNHFDSTHVCADDQEEGGVKTRDEFDDIIDYGDRRDRLRKNFEWEMDRLYLSEELERRKSERTAARRDQTAQQGQVMPPTFNLAHTQLNRQEWSAFRRLARVEEQDAFVIDVLIGEPNIPNDVGRRTKFMVDFEFEPGKRQTSSQVETATFKAAGEGQIPERIRIHSKALVQIFEALLSRTLGGPVLVFTRPFKALIFCQEALRKWAERLEKRLGSTTAPNQGSVNEATTPKVNFDPAAPLQPEKVHGQGSAKEKADRNKSAPAEYDSSDDGYASDDEDDLTISQTALDHLKCLLRFVDSDISPKLNYLKSPDSRKVFFSDLWHLFRPGVEVTSGDGKQAYRVIDVTGAKHRVVLPWEKWSLSPGKRKRAPFSITCVYIDFDGHNIGPVPKVFDFRRFDGQRDITSLEVYPLHFHPSSRRHSSETEWRELEPLPAYERHRRKLMRRGAKFLDVAAVKHMYYAGQTIDTREEVESQVVIDFETALSVKDEAQKLWKPELTMMVTKTTQEDSDSDDDDDEACQGSCCRRDTVHDDSYVDEDHRSNYVNSLLPAPGDSNDQPSIAIIPRPFKELGNGTRLATDDELVIMSYRVFGFVLRSRKWAQLDLSYLTDVHRSTGEVIPGEQNDGKTEEFKTAFDNLVLEEWHRPMIVSLIAQHFRDKSNLGQREEFDIVKGKGKGLILLLHGAPGVGKTSTAEGVAELFNRPLFQITCGDLGTTAQEVEKSLETNFALANRWDCILLLDEADVFLAERTKLDFKRNGLVAAFLRVMEYYAGILFLTTNRVGDFDEAFTSRIHVSLYYPDLNADKTVDVFKLNMDMIEKRFIDKKRSINIDRMGIARFATQHFEKHPEARWNGRQIRNACQTALALAEFEAQGNSHQAILRPDAVVTLGVKEFEIVRDAYLKFTEYMQSLYGSNSARRAKEARTRAMELEKNNKSGMAVDKRAAFGAASYPQPQASQDQWRQPQPATQDYWYQGGAAQYPGYADARHMQGAQTSLSSANQAWGVPGGRNVLDPSAPSQPPTAGGPGYGPPPPPQQQAFPPGFDQRLWDLWVASHPQGAGPVPPTAAPSQQWIGPSGSGPPPQE